MDELTIAQDVVRQIRVKNGVDEGLLRRAEADEDFRSALHNLKNGYARALEM